MKKNYWMQILVLGFLCFHTAHTVLEDDNTEKIVKPKPKPHCNKFQHMDETDEGTYEIISKEYLEENPFTKYRKGIKSFVCWTQLTTTRFDATGKILQRSLKYGLSVETINVFLGKHFNSTQNDNTKPDKNPPPIVKKVNGETVTEEQAVTCKHKYKILELDDTLQKQKVDVWIKPEKSDQRILNPLLPGGGDDCEDNSLGSSSSLPTLQHSAASDEIEKDLNDVVYGSMHGLVYPPISPNEIPVLFVENKIKTNQKNHCHTVSRNVLAVKCSGPSTEKLPAIDEKVFPPSVEFLSIGPVPEHIPKSFILTKGRRNCFMLFLLRQIPCSEVPNIKIKVYVSEPIEFLPVPASTISATIEILENDITLQYIFLKINYVTISKKPKCYLAEKKVHRSTCLYNASAYGNSMISKKFPKNVEFVESIPELLNEFLVVRKENHCYYFKLVKPVTCSDLQQDPVLPFDQITKEVTPVETESIMSTPLSIEKIPSNAVKRTLLKSYTFVLKQYKPYSTEELCVRVLPKYYVVNCPINLNQFYKFNETTLLKSPQELQSYDPLDPGFANSDGYIVAKGNHNCFLFVKQEQLSCKDVKKDILILDTEHEDQIYETTTQTTNFITTRTEKPRETTPPIESTTSKITLDYSYLDREQDNQERTTESKALTTTDETTGTEKPVETALSTESTTEPTMSTITPDSFYFDTEHIDQESTAELAKQITTDKITRTEKTAQTIPVTQSTTKSTSSIILTYYSYFDRKHNDQEDTPESTTQTTTDKTTTTEKTIETPTESSTDFTTSTIIRDYPYFGTEEQGATESTMQTTTDKTTRTEEADENTPPTHSTAEVTSSTIFPDYSYFDTAHDFQEDTTELNTRITTDKTTRAEKTTQATTFTQSTTELKTSTVLSDFSYFTVKISDLKNFKKAVCYWVERTVEHSECLESSKDYENHMVSEDALRRAQLVYSTPVLQEQYIVALQENHCYYFKIVQQVVCQSDVKNLIDLVRVRKNETSTTVPPTVTETYTTTPILTTPTFAAEVEYILPLEVHEESGVSTSYITIKQKYYQTECPENLQILYYFNDTFLAKPPQTLPENASDPSFVHSNKFILAKSEEKCFLFEKVATLNCKNIDKNLSSTSLEKYDEEDITTKNTTIESTAVTMPTMSTTMLETSFFYTRIEYPETLQDPVCYIVEGKVKYSMCSEKFRDYHVISTHIPGDLEWISSVPVISEEFIVAWKENRCYYLKIVHPVTCQNHSNDVVILKDVQTYEVNSTVIPAVDETTTTTYSSDELFRSSVQYVLPQPYVLQLIVTTHNTLKRSCFNIRQEYYLIKCPQNRDILYHFNQALIMSSPQSEPNETLNTNATKSKKYMFAKGQWNCFVFEAIESVDCEDITGKVLYLSKEDNEVDHTATPITTNSNTIVATQTSTESEDITYDIVVKISFPDPDQDPTCYLTQRRIEYAECKDDGSSYNIHIISESMPENMELVRVKHIQLEKYLTAWKNDQCYIFKELRPVLCLDDAEEIIDLLDLSDEEESETVEPTMSSEATFTIPIQSIPTIVTKSTATQSRDITSTTLYEPTTIKASEAIQSTITPSTLTESTTASDSTTHISDLNDFFVPTHVLTNDIVLLLIDYQQNTKIESCTRIRKEYYEVNCTDSISNPYKLDELLLQKNSHSFQINQVASSSITVDHFRNPNKYIWAKGQSKCFLFQILEVVNCNEVKEQMVSFSRRPMMEGSTTDTIPLLSTIAMLPTIPSTSSYNINELDSNTKPVILFEVSKNELSNIRCVYISSEIIQVECPNTTTYLFLTEENPEVMKVVPKSEVTVLESNKFFFVRKGNVCYKFYRKDGPSCALTLKGALKLYKLHPDSKIKSNYILMKMFQNAMKKFKTTTEGIKTTRISESSQTTDSNLENQRGITLLDWLSTTVESFTDEPKMLSTTISRGSEQVEDDDVIVQSMDLARPQNLDIKCVKVQKIVFNIKCPKRKESLYKVGEKVSLPDVLREVKVNAVPSSLRRSALFVDAITQCFIFLPVQEVDCKVYSQRALNVIRYYNSSDYSFEGDGNSNEFEEHQSSVLPSTTTAIPLAGSVFHWLSIFKPIVPAQNSSLNWTNKSTNLPLMNLYYFDKNGNAKRDCLLINETIFSLPCPTEDISNYELYDDKFPANVQIVLLRKIPKFFSGTYIFARGAKSCYLFKKQKSTSCFYHNQNEIDLFKWPSNTAANIQITTTHAPEVLSVQVANQQFLVRMYPIYQSHVLGPQCKLVYKPVIKIKCPVNTKQFYYLNETYLTKFSTFSTFENIDKELKINNIILGRSKTYCYVFRIANDAACPLRQSDALDLLNHEENSPSPFDIKEIYGDNYPIVTFNKEGKNKSNIGFIVKIIDSLNKPSTCRVVDMNVIKIKCLKSTTNTYISNKLVLPKHAKVIQQDRTQGLKDSRNIVVSFQGECYVFGSIGEIQCPKAMELTELIKDYPRNWRTDFVPLSRISLKRTANKYGKSRQSTQSKASHKSSYEDDRYIEASSFDSTTPYEVFVDSTSPTISKSTSSMPELIRKPNWVAERDTMEIRPVYRTVPPIPTPVLFNHVRSKGPKLQPTPTPDYLTEWHLHKNGPAHKNLLPLTPQGHKSLQLNQINSDSNESPENLWGLDSLEETQEPITVKYIYRGNIKCYEIDGHINIERVGCPSNLSMVPRIVNPRLVKMICRSKLDHYHKNLRTKDMLMKYQLLRYDNPNIDK